jgi:dTDP-glucose 4,6-dehydratase
MTTSLQDRAGGAGRPGRRFRRAVVLGGAGFVGSHVCEALLAAGTSVLCVDNFLTGSASNVASLTEEPGFRLVEHDVTTPLDPEVLVEPVDLVLHLASPASPVDYLRHPLQTLQAGSYATEQALMLARDHGARFLLASTSEVYGDAEVHPQPETYLGNVNPIGPRSVYDEAKRYAEALTFAYHRTYDVDVVVARIFNTYGTRMRPADGRLVPAFIGAALAGEPLTVFGDGEQTRSLCHVSDTVAGLLALAAADTTGPVNVGNPDECTVLALAERIIALVGSGSTIRHGPPVTDDPHRRCPDISRANALLGWRPTVGLDDGLQDTIQWFAAHRESALVST